MNEHERLVRSYDGVEPATREHLGPWKPRMTKQQVRERNKTSAKKHRIKKQEVLCDLAGLNRILFARGMR